jgi:hypothetical protein
MRPARFDELREAESLKIEEWTGQRYGEEFLVGSSLEVVSDSNRLGCCQPIITGLALLLVASITAALALHSTTVLEVAEANKSWESTTVGEQTSNFGNKRRDERHLERRDAGESIEIGTVIDTVLCANQKLFRNRLIANTLRSLVLSNGEGGIRTRGELSPTQHFQCCAFGRSATSPSIQTSLS